MEAQQPILKVGTRLVLSSHDVMVEHILPDRVLCRMIGGQQISATFKQIEQALDLFSQMVGRGLRIDPGKQDCISRR